MNEISMNEVGEKIDFQTITKGCRDLNFQELMQLLKLNISIFWSWGAHNFIVDSAKRTRMFRMNVQGHHHKGHVYIFVNGSDLFDVYLTTTQGTIKKKIEGLYFDQLVDWIDENVEKIPDYIR
jgi:hypothetical protein